MRTWYHRSTLGVAALAVVGMLASGCGEGAGTDEPREVNDASSTESLSAEAEDAAETASWEQGEEITVTCDDLDALASHEDREPAGLPHEWEEGTPLPDPECHPDFIEVREWDRLDEFRACWEGEETSTLIMSPGMTDEDVHEYLWHQSSLRAEWEWPDVEAWEQRVDNAFGGLSAECEAAAAENYGS
ncbi:hypothetical protein [Garicola koreensis]|uniref:Uncharacterized protein n=1 Tax=Garicola koreensis TaxID=1262554 RepID=A0A7W5TVB5_9MICC|nr:hypothetical protein [Garicola koreensis]MBB3668327.1 hypothetical protein [Garicola koreensis]MBB3668433.1 hypothetical protein [Garicola koreensis]